MIVSFIGSPRSGKTTTAASLFAELKVAGFNCEFVTEQARLHIAKKKIELHSEGSGSLLLTDEDQLSIAKSQLEIENIFLRTSGKDSIIITDSSCLNALLYLSKPELLQDVVDRAKQRKTLFFYSQTVESNGFAADLNRVHSLEQSKKLDKEIPSKILPLLEKYTILLGAPEERSKTAYQTVLSYLTGMRF